MVKHRTYTFYEVRINGRTYARFEVKAHAEIFVLAWLAGTTGSEIRIDTVQRTTL